MLFAIFFINLSIKICECTRSGSRRDYGETDRAGDPEAHFGAEVSLAGRK